MTNMIATGIGNRKQRRVAKALTKSTSNNKRWAKDIAEMVSLFNTQKYKESAEIATRLIEADPKCFEAIMVFGGICFSNESYEQGAAYFKAASELRPHVADTWFYQANCLDHLSRREEAIPLVEKALSLNPDHVEALAKQARILAERGRPDEALQIADKIFDMPRQKPSQVFDLARAYQAAGDHVRGIKLFAEGYNKFKFRSFGEALLELLVNIGAYGEAAQIGDELIEQNPKEVRYMLRLSYMNIRIGDAQKALHYARMAMEADPEELNSYIAVAFAGQHINSQISVQALAIAEQKAPENEVIHYTKAQLYQSIGDQEKAIEGFQKAIALNPKLLQAWTSYLFLRNQTVGSDPATLAAEHFLFGGVASTVTDSHRRTLHKNNRDPDRILKVGYVSGDFYEHVAINYFEPLLRLHDRSKIEVHAFSNTYREDRATQFLREKVKNWHDIRMMSESQVADLVEHLGIDILVDLSGHTTGNVLPAFAMRPAPVSVSYIGYPNTTGLTEMDWYMTDGVLVPPEHEGFFAERVYRLPRSSVTIQPPAKAPLAEVPPMEKNGYVTFGSFNNPQKISDTTLRAWARILDTLPDSRLILKFATFRDLNSCETFGKRFEAFGISKNRLEFRPSSILIEYLDEFKDIDITLDTFPYNGATSSLYSAWQGVPVVSIKGNSIQSRNALWVANHAGIADETMADDVEGYIETALRLARSPETLKTWRHLLRDNLSASPALDEKQIVRDVEDAYRAMWHDWLARTA
jgi:protein O-GlcNAc transferase